MAYTLDIGPNLLTLGTRVLLLAAACYLVVQYWVVASVRGRR